MLQTDKTGLGLSPGKDSVHGWADSTGTGNFEIPQKESLPKGGEMLNEEAAKLKITRRDLIYFIGQLSIMFETGLNLMTALDCLVLQAKNPALKKLVKSVQSSISEGSPLWAAMARHPKVFGPICISMVPALTRHPARQSDESGSRCRFPTSTAAHLRSFRIPTRAKPH